MREQLIKAALAEFESIALKSRANLEVYLSSAAGIGEHSDVVGEIVKLTTEITEAEDNIKTLEELLASCFHGEING
tara:strand:+ start:380 stop:607 length:228 start_codon:yes stop_codon:yes gene_type:complete